MLKQRIITALILAPLVIWGIFALPNDGFVAFVALITILGAWEWSRLSGLQALAGRLAFVAVVAVLLVVLWKLLLTDVAAVQLMLLVASGGWLLALAGLFYYRKNSVSNINQPLLKLLVGLIILLGPFIALTTLRNNPEYGASFVMYMLMLIWIADSAAYFAGRQWGKNKLLVNVSPGKSWEGVMGALLASVIFAIIAGNWFDLTQASLVVFVALSMIVVVFSIAGDLVESLFKRQVNLKDSGQLLPGHGGILDRIDSLTAAAPVFVAGLLSMEIVI